MLRTLGPAEGNRRMSAVDDAIATIGRAHSGVGEATKIVYHAIQACERYGIALAGVGLAKPAEILHAARTTLQDKVHVGLAATDGNATKALESLRAARGSDDLDKIAAALALGKRQLADMRGTAGTAVGNLDHASGQVSRIGTKSRNIIALLAQAHKKLDEVAQHGTAAEAATDTTAGAVTSDQDFT